SKVEQFKQGWADALALPDNLPDLALDTVACVSIPCLLSSCWVILPIPGFIRLAVLGVLIIAGAWTCYLYQAIPQIKAILLIRVGLILLGVLLGL
ncbi:hypothetical protein I8752_30265, partial [Nostocaceae cyanobacterium CENA369]